MADSGLNAVLGKLNKVTPAMKKQIKAANKDAAADVARVARARAPQISGKLANSVKPYGTAKGAGVQAGGARVRYAAGIHFGVGPRRGRPGPHNISPNPFLFDATDERRRAVIERYELAAAKAIDEAGL